MVIAMLGTVAPGNRMRGEGDKAMNRDKLTKQCAQKERSTDNSMCSEKETK